MTGTRASWIARFCSLALALALTWGCSRDEGGEGTAATAPPAAPDGMEYCDFKSGPADAAVEVVAFYPGRHEDTLDAVRNLLEVFPGQVRVEIVDWRHAEGLRRRDAAGLICAGVVINGKNVFDLEVGGRTSKVMFIRGLDGEWTAEELQAAVRQEVAAAK